MTFSERLFWIKDNSDWLIRWYYDRIPINQIGNLPMQKFFLREDEEFYNTLITTMVFSRHSVAVRSRSFGPEVHETIAGFVQQIGRLPTQDDKVQLLVYREGIRPWKPNPYTLDLTMHMGWFYLIIPEANYGNEKESLGQSPSKGDGEESKTST